MMNQSDYDSDDGPRTNKKTEPDENETRATFITPAQIMSSGIQHSPDGSENEDEEEIKEKPRIFEGREARSSSSRKQTRIIHSQQDQEDQKQELTATEKKQKRALNKRAQFLQELYRKEKQEFQRLEKRSNISKVKFLLEQADTFTNFLLDVQKKKGIRKDTAVIKFIKKGLTKEELKDDEEIEPTRLMQQPANLKNGLLKEYQLDALNWLIGLYQKGLNGILADQMGLGKTIETIAFLAYLRTLGIQGPFLIIVPLSTFYNWRNECRKWCPSLRLFMLRALKERKIENRERFQNRDFDVIICSYQSCIKAMGQLKKLFFKVIVIDEAHRIKNEETILASNVRCLHSSFRLLLTGTPMQNTLRELWALLNYIFPDIFANAEEFEGILDITENKGKVLEQQIQKLHRILSFFMLRRTKADVLTEIPRKKEYIMKIPLSQQQIKLYKRLIIETGSVGTMRGYRNVLMQLRKACQHPYLFPEEVPYDGVVPLQIMIRASNKLAVLDRLLKKFRKQGHQVLIFSQFVMWIECLVYYLDLRGYKYSILIGQTDIEQRQIQIEEFNKQGSKIEIFVLSTRAGGLGINLTSASKVIIYDSDFNPHVDIQAIDRCHRIGQTKVVEVIRFVSQDTVEENIIERQIIKLRLDELIVQQGRLAPRFKNLTSMDLQNAILHGADRFINNAVVPANIYDDKDFDLKALMKESEENALILKKKVENEIKDKLNDQILEDIELTYQKINCINEEDQKRRQEVKDRIKNQFLQQILQSERPASRVKAPKLQSLPVRKRYFKPWQFPEKRDLLLKLIEKNDESLFDKIDALQSTGFTRWGRSETQALIRGIRNEGISDISALADYLPKKEKAQIKKYLETMLKRKDELKDCGMLLPLNNALDRFSHKEQNVDLLDEYITKVYKMEQLGKIEKLSYISPIQRALLVLTYELGYEKWSQVKEKLLEPSQRWTSVYINTFDLFSSTNDIKEILDSALEKLKINQFKEPSKELKKIKSQKKFRERSQSKEVSANLMMSLSEDESNSITISKGKELAPKMKNKAVVRKKKSIK